MDGAVLSVVMHGRLWILQYALDIDRVEECFGGLRQEMIGPETRVTGTSQNCMRLEQRRLRSLVRRLKLQRGW